MLKTVVSIFKNKDLRRQMFFTLAILVVFRLGASLTVPGVVIRQSFGANSVFSIINMLGGGALRQFSLFALGVSPYITASIVVQLLAMDIVPSWKLHLKSGENGRKEISKITKRMSLFLAILQASALTYGMLNQGYISFENTKTSFAFIMLVLVAGSMVTVFLGDKISEYGIGNGLSIIIFAGIVASIPYQIYQTFQMFVVGDSAQALFSGVLNFAFYMAAWYFLISFMVYVDSAERKVPVQYSSAYDITRKEEVSYLPLKVNIGGVIPLIFASSMILAPVTIASFFPTKTWAIWVTQHFTLTNSWGLTAYVFMIFGFTFFQAHASVNAEDISESLANSSSFIPGVRAGLETKDYVSRIVNRISCFGGAFLVIVAIMPLVASHFMKVQTPLQLGGSAMIIVAGVALETYRQIQGKLFQDSYKGFEGSDDVSGNTKDRIEKGEW